MYSLYSKSLNAFTYSFSPCLLRVSYALSPVLSTGKSIRTLNPGLGISGVHTLVKGDVKNTNRKLNSSVSVRHVISNIQQKRCEKTINEVEIIFQMLQEMSLGR